MNAATVARFLPLLFISLILPWFGHSRRGILFGVTVPLDFVSSPTARSVVRRYQRRIYTVILIVFAAVTLTLWLAPSSPLACTSAPAIAILFEIVVNFFFWRSGTRAIKPHAITIPLERHTELVLAPTRGPIVLTALSLLPLAGTALWLRLRWNQIPARWPQHWDASGNVNGWAIRSIGGVFAPLISGAIMILMLLAVALFLARASGPQTSQRRRALVPFAAISWLVTGLFCLIGSLPLTHFSSANLMIVSIVYLTVIFAAAVWMLWRSGLAPFSNATDPYDSTPDARWYGSIIYYNPSDAAIIVPMRFGWGWTLNFARPSAWLYISAALLAGAAMTLLPNLLK